MRKYKYNYQICNKANNDIFHRQCNALEKNIPSLIKDGMVLEDVDGTLIQKYVLSGHQIRVCSDTEIDYVIVNSDVELQQYFKT